MKEREKWNLRYDTKSLTNFPEGFDWMDTLLTEATKQAIEDFLVDYHNIFARKRKEIGMNTDLEAKLTAKDDKRSTTEI